MTRAWGAGYTASAGLSSSQCAPPYLLTAYALKNILLGVQLLTSDEFAEWFGALDESTAEDVATTLEVITQLGLEKEAPGSSEWLTWYEHPSLSERLRTLDPAWQLDPAVSRFIHAWGLFNGYARRIVKHLESPQFVARLAHLTPRDAAIVTGAVARIKKATTRRWLAVSEYQQRHPAFGRRPPTPAEQAALARFLDEQEIRDAYLAALAAAGFAVVDVPAHSPALREISLRVPPPGFRLLYGIDSRRNRGLVVLGEPLDRSFYGDSVRRGERTWQEFLNGELRTTQPAGLR